MKHIFEIWIDEECHIFEKFDDVKEWLEKQSKPIWLDDEERLNNEIYIYHLLRFGVWLFYADTSLFKSLR